MISSQFTGKGRLERQAGLWAELEKLLAPDPLAGIVVILTMTPDEVDDDVRASNG